MPGTEGFLELAGIAGVFVGFGALIAVRGGGSLEVDELAQMRNMVWMGVLAVVAALAPVALGRYELAEHQVWALASVLVLLGFVMQTASMARTPEYRATWAKELEADRLTRPRWILIVMGTAYVLYVMALAIGPIVIALGVAPDLEAALYFTVVALILLGAAWILLALVLSQRRPANV